MYKVFLIEDEIVIREALERMIPWNEYGFELVGKAKDGEIALPMIRKTKPDVLITDIKMPFMDGLTLSGIVKKEIPEIRIVIVSGYDDFEYARKAIALGVDDYLLKPIDTEQLRACMRRLLSQRTKKHYITVTYSGTETKILLSNIQCLESNLRKVIFTLSENREIEVVGKLTDYEEFLLHHGFCRCHKSYLVNMEYIDSIDNDVFYLTSGKTMKISRTYLQSAKKAYFDYVFAAEGET